MDLVEYYSRKNVNINRGVFRELHRSRIEICTKEIIRDALDFVTLKNDYWQVLEANKRRFATVLKKDESGCQFWDAVSRPEEAAKYNEAIYPTISTGIFREIASATSCLFSSPYQSWKFLKGEDDNEDVEQLITFLRDSGGFDIAINGADYCASSVNCCMVHVFPKGEWLSYETLWPSDVRIIYGDMVSETLSDGRQVPRFSDHSDIEDARAVIIRMGQVADSEFNANPDQNVYHAYIGSCTEWPYGRMMTYRQNDFWPIPDPGSALIIDEYTHVTDGICNPMSHVARKTKNFTGQGYEYPIAVIRGDMRFGANGVLPTSDSLYLNSIELDRQWSHLLNNADRCSGGTRVIKLGNHVDLPKSLDIVVLRDGQEFDIVTGDPNGVIAHRDILDSASRAVAASHSVPSYIAIGSSPAQVESGIALAIKTQPLIKGRDKRIKMNRASVEKIFSIEQALLTEINPKYDSMFKDVSMRWVPGEWVPAMDPTTASQEIVSLRDAGLIDHYEALRRANYLPTIDDAIKLDKTYAERDKDYVSAENTVTAKGIQVSELTQDQPQEKQNDGSPDEGDNGNSRRR